VAEKSAVILFSVQAIENMQKGIIKSCIIILLTFMITSKIYGKDMTIKVIYNNLAYDKELTCSWGMSCVIKGLDKTILFDTGGDGNILLSNMKKMRIHPKEIDIVVLSHIHGDHTGGLWKFLEENPEVTVYIPSSFPEKFKNRIKDLGACFVEVGKPIEIFPSVYSTGELGTWIKEQALILNIEEGLIIITGCSHPGIVAIAEKAIHILNEKIYLITGGFHLGGATEVEINDIIQDLKAIGVQKIAPSHCTGKRAIECFKDAWDNNFIEAGCGAEIEFLLLGARQ